MAETELNYGQHMEGKSRWADLNRRPTDYESVALATELHRRKCQGAESNCRHTDFQSVALPTELPWHKNHPLHQKRRSWPGDDNKTNKIMSSYYDYRK